jgi:hypothetical protein
MQQQDEREHTALTCQQGMEASGGGMHAGRAHSLDSLSTEASIFGASTPAPSMVLESRESKVGGSIR